MENQPTTAQAYSVPRGTSDDGGTTPIAARHDGKDLRSGVVSANQSASLPLSTSWREEPLSEVETRKVAEVLAACRDQDHEKLAELASSTGGFIEDEVRRVAWPTVLDCSDSGRHDSNWTKLERHRDEDQVKLDVNRSFVYYPENEDEKQLDRRKDELSHVITEVLRRHPMLCYFQGYHDIVQVLLLVLGTNAAVPAVTNLSLLRIRDFMLPSINGALSHLHLLPAILHAADPVVYKHLSQTNPFFALSATLTLYAHDIEEYGDIARLFDFLLAREAAVSVYLFAVIILSRKDQLLEIEAEEPDMLHSVLSKLPKPLDLEGLISQTTALFKQCPPEKLPFRAWYNISRYSVLKTTRRRQELSKQTLQDGEKLFAKQAAELQAVESRKRLKENALRMVRKYKTPVRTAGIAIAVAVLAYYLSNTGGAATFLSYLTR